MKRFTREDNIWNVSLLPDPPSLLPCPVHLFLPSPHPEASCSNHLLNLPATHWCWHMVFCLQPAPRAVTHFAGGLILFTSKKHHFLQCYHTSTGGKSVLGHKVLYPHLYLRGAMLLLPLHRDEFKYTICHQQSGTAWSGILLYIRTDPFYVLNCDVTRQNNK